MGTQRKTGGRSELDGLTNAVNGLIYTLRHSVQDDPAIGNGTTTAGNLRTNAVVGFTVAGLVFSKASTDDFWDLSGETDTTATQFRSYWLYVDASGTGTFVAGTNSADAASALANLPPLDLTQAVFGVYTAGLSTDFDDAGGLAAQGTIDDGVPAGVPGMSSVPDVIALVAP